MGNNTEQACLPGLLSMNPGSDSQRRSTPNRAGTPTVCLLPGWWKQRHKGLARHLPWGHQRREKL